MYGIEEIDTHSQDPFLDFLLRLRRVTGQDTLLLSAFEQVQREAFLPQSAQGRAYEDSIWPLPLGQTTTRPILMAQMLKALEIQPHHKVLEIGTGSGYGTALLAHMAGQVWSVERYRTLSQAAQSAVRQVRQEPSIQFFVQDGLQGLSSFAPYDRIIAWGAVPALPKEWLAQLSQTGKAVAFVQGKMAGAQLVVHDKFSQRQAHLPVISEALPLLMPKRARVM